MKIAMIGQKGYPAHYGGVERHVAEISERLVRYGHTVTVYNREWYGGKQHGNVNGITITTVPTIRTKHLDAIVHTFLSTFHAIFKKVDIIHYHGVGPSLLSWIPRVFSPKTLIVSTFHSIDRYHEKWGWFARTMLRLGERFSHIFPHETIVIAPALESYCRKEFKAKTHYIPNGTTIHDEDATVPYHTKTTILDEFNLEKNNYLLLVSRLIPAKASHILIDAFVHLKESHKENDIVRTLKLVIVGGSVYTNTYVASLHKQASACSDIIFTDFQSGGALEDLFRGSLGFIHPSITEGMPLAVLEAMGYGKPTLVSAIPEHIQLIQNPHMLFRENDPDALEEKILEFLNLSQQEQDAIGQANKIYVTKNYDWKHSTEMLVNLYESAYATHIKPTAKHQVKTAHNNA